MCYEFLHNCKESFITKLAGLAPANSFFVICIGELNYLYFQNTQFSEQAISFLAENGITLHRLPPEEMLSVLDFAATKEYQVFYGSQPLYHDFRQQFTVA